EVDVAAHERRGAVERLHMPVPRAPLISGKHDFREVLRDVELLPVIARFEAKGKRSRGAERDSCQAEVAAAMDGAVAAENRLDVAFVEAIEIQRLLIERIEQAGSGDVAALVLIRREQRHIL